MKPRILPNLAAAFFCGVMLLLGGAGGCGNHDSHGSGEESGGHHHRSVHGGVLVELGEHEFQLDVVLDRGAGAIRAWVMDAHVENFVRIAAASLTIRIEAGGPPRDLVLAALANPSTGETVGATSEFRGEAPWLKDLTAFQGVLQTLEVRGRTYRNVRFSYPAGNP